MFRLKNLISWRKNYIIFKKLITLRKYQEHKDEMCD